MDSYPHLHNLGDELNEFIDTRLIHHETRGGCGDDWCAKQYLERLIHEYGQAEYERGKSDRDN